MALIDVCADIAGNVWKVLAAPGQAVAEEDELIILESMKMEIPVETPSGGTVEEVLVAPNDTVTEGQVLARVRTD